MFFDFHILNFFEMISLTYSYEQLCDHGASTERLAQDNRVAATPLSRPHQSLPLPDTQRFV